jgi:predicted RNase H-like nuclease (RuvC/YqgF family)
MSESPAAAARSHVPALADEVDRLRTENEQLQELNGQQARHIEELRKPVQEHCRRWHIPAITERDAALAEVTRLTAIIESAENLCARRCFSAALGGGSDD